ncbi:MAG: hypothetical protein RBU31_08425, partial [Syntrophales bacterium]|nr:hypothetical protein [Syntrophales bacterium]
FSNPDLVAHPTHTLHDYLSMVGKFRHLSKDQVAHLQHTLDTRLDLLKSIAVNSPEKLAAKEAREAICGC